MRSRWTIWGLAILGACGGAVLVASETATAIHAHRDNQTPYQFTVSVFGVQIHQSAVATNEELLPRMRTWAYGLMATFMIGGGIAGTILGMGYCRFGRKKPAEAA